jgi:hypothetical protein
VRNPEDEDDMFSKTLVLTTATRYKVPEAHISDTAVKASQKTVFFDHIYKVLFLKFNIEDLYNLMDNI